MKDDMIQKIAENIITNSSYRLLSEDAVKLALLPTEYDLDLIYHAGKIREHYLGNTIFTCSITNAKSGHCTEDCAFCAQSSYNTTDIKTYPLLDEDILVKKALEYRRQGASRYSMVTSGFKLKQEEMDIICRAAERVRKETDMIVCASVGVIDIPYIRQMKSSGITRYHHNLETSRSYFDAICTTHRYEDDIDAVLLAKQEGMDVCSGGIFGLGETWEQRVELACDLRELDVDAIPLNFLNPIKGTRLEKRNPLKPFDGLKAIAITRFLNPGRHITICGGREITLSDFQSYLFQAGADGLMIGNYLTTLGRAAENDIEMIRQLSLKIENR
ncbi:MAG: biotin synthase BioB [Proteobacteria bacterium]|nr:biotin synthase BioB [Pseudomonadota bacterium]